MSAAERSRNEHLAEKRSFEGKCEMLRTISQPRTLSADIPASQKGVYLFYNPPINFHTSQHAWLTVLPAPCFYVRLEFFSLSSVHAKVTRERLVYFVVSKHSVLILYFMKCLSKTKPVSVLVTFFTIKDVGSIFC